MYPHLCRPLRAAVLSVVGILVGQAQASPPGTTQSSSLSSSSISHSSNASLSFTAALERAEQESPKLVADGAQIAAMRSAAAPAAALPDPKVFVGVDNFPVSGPDAGRLQRDFMTMEKIGVMQDYPNADKRRAQGAAAAADIDAAIVDRSLDLLSVRRDAALAWLDLYYLQSKATVLSELNHENVILAQTVQAQVTDGHASTADAIAPRQEAAQLADRQDELELSLVKARAKLEQLVGPVAENGIAGNPPLWTVDTQRLHEHLHHHPELLAFDVRARKAEADVALAQSAKRSDWGVEVAYQRRAPQFGNMVSVQFTFDLPISPGIRQEPLITAKERELDRLNAERDDMLRQHLQELDSDLAEYASLSRQLDRARQTALPLAEQKVSLQTASYQAGKTDLNAVLAARRERIELRMHVLDLQAVQADVAARLHFAYGEDPQ